MFSYRSPEDRIPLDHPLLPMRVLVDEALEEGSPLFAEFYARTGRPSIPPERLLRALLLHTTKRSSRIDHLHRDGVQPGAPPNLAVPS